MSQPPEAPPAPLSITPLSQADQARLGGKARGLARLLALDLQVPPGFVISGDPGADAGAITAAHARLGAPLVAVRSSATCEDSASASAAGQFDTLLDVDGPKALLDAVRQCFASLDGEQAAAYMAHQQAAGEPAAMAVVVQRMIQGQVSGVLFTRDPTPGGDREQVLVEACEGRGEQLVSGLVPATRQRLPRQGPVSPPADDDGPLTSGLLTALRDQALAAEDRLGYPLDLEWTVDREGQLYWLQARPITTLELTGTDELDIRPVDRELFFTRANVGEMLPGAATPLTISVFRKAVDFAMHELYRSTGAIAREDRQEPMVCCFSNHLFFNLRLVYQIVGRVIGTSPEGLELGILGRELDDRPQVRQSSGLLRLINFVRYMVHVSRHRGAIRRLERFRDSFQLADSGSAAERYQALDRSLPQYDRITALHMQVSARSGALNSTLRSVFDKAGITRDQQLEALGALLSNIDGIESAAIIRDLDQIAREVRRALQQTPLSAATFQGWLLDPARSGRAGALFAEFLQRNGHRCVREAELRELEWGEDPGELAHQLWATASAPERTEPPALRPWQETIDQLCEAHPGLSRRAVTWLAGSAREAVKQREHTKSILIRSGNRLRRAYRQLGALLSAEGRLPDADLLFFFTHQELEQLLEGPVPAPLLTRALHRRRLLPLQMELRFPDFCRGAPVPLAAPELSDDQDGIFRGLPVSPGRVRGAIRVINDKQDARALQPGEIICARFTDVGWTPYYSTAGGVITEIGSALSHGAVVAREYQLPLITSIEGATSLFRTGELVELDGTSGQVSRVSGGSAAL